MRVVDYVLVTVATAGSLVAAQPHHQAAHGHRHHHRHVDKRSPDTDIVTVKTEVYAFEFDGQPMTQEDVCKGIANKSLTWAEAPGPNEDPCGSSLSSSEVVSSSASTSISSASSSSPAGNVLFQESTTSTSTTTSSTPKLSPTSSSSAQVIKAFAASTSAAPTSATPTSAASTSIASTAAASTFIASTSAASSSGSLLSGSTSSDSDLLSNPNVDKPFPDGTLSCSHFPSDYGAISIDWMEMDGWAGLQYIQISGNVVTSIVTGTPGSSCQNTADGTAMCSYACPAGYQKSQWSAQQGSKGQSVGGIVCGPDNKLHLTNPGLASTLCIQGSGNVNVQNKLGNNVPICRTDYPGTEDETVPLNTQPGSTNPLTCPVASSYYMWENKYTSAQYYVNPQGTPVSKGCTWSANGTDVGNFAPLYFGVGTDTSDKTWLSITSTQQQNPANYQNLDYSIALQGEFGGTAACFMTVKGGIAYYCSAGTPSSFSKSSCATFIKCTSSNADTCNESPGCTVELLSGKATYVLE